jgi:6,7-dimethyl-8-ribityllumazine synthase
LRIGIVVSRFNDFITDRLLSAAQQTIRDAGVAADVIVLRVPGAFEIPIAAQRLAESARVDAVVCLGCVIRGETPHFEYIAAACAHGITAAAAATGVPMTFGVLTTNTEEEALARAGEGDANKGREAALAAIELLQTLQTLEDRSR